MESKQTELRDLVWNADPGKQTEVRDLVWNADPDTSGTCFKIDQLHEQWSKERHKYNNGITDWRERLRNFNGYLTPCPTAMCSQLGPDLKKSSFRLYHVGELLTVDRILKNEGQIKFPSPKFALHGESPDAKHAPMMVTKAYITRYSTKGLKYPVRATLHTGQGEVLPVPDVSNATVCNFDGPRDKGVLLFTDMDAVENADAYKSPGTWITYHDTSSRLRWMHRLSRFDAHKIRARIGLAGSAVEVEMHYDANTGLPLDFLTWMTGHFYPYLLAFEVEKKQQQEVKSDSKSVIVSRAGLLALVDLLEEYGGRKQLMNAKEGFFVQFKIGDGGRTQLMRERDKELEEQKVDALDRNAERVSAWVEVTLEYFQYQKPQNSLLSEGVDFGKRYLEGSTTTTN